MVLSIGDWPLVATISKQSIPITGVSCKLFSIHVKNRIDCHERIVDESTCSPDAESAEGTGMSTLMFLRMHWGNAYHILAEF